MYITLGGLCEKKITVVGTLVTVSPNGSCSVHYRPLKDEYAGSVTVFDSFQVNAVDGISYEESVEVRKETDKYEMIYHALKDK
jgi:hypothetical protein